MRKSLLRPVQILFVLLFYSNLMATPSQSIPLIDEITILSIQDNSKVKIKGTVTDESGKPIIGVTVLDKGTQIGTVTNMYGKFILNIPRSAKVIIFSFIGMKTQEIAFNKQSIIDVKLISDTRKLNDVVVTGYSVQSKESLTSSMAVVSNKKLKNITTPNVENMLNGKVSGVQVAPGSGKPGEAGAIIIRGKSTINGSNSPLWVIDGVIVGSSVGDINPNDIKSISILKDAASTAIYGSQGANGVIVVSTKSATSGKVTVNASGKLGVTSLNNGNYKSMNGTELYDYYSSFSNAKDISFSRWNKDLRNSNFDWWNFASHTGLAQDYNISVTGGSDKIKSMLSIGLYDEDGAIKGYDFMRYNIRYKSSYDVTKWLTLKTNIAGSRRDISDHQHSVADLYTYLPWDRAIDKDGNAIKNRSSSWVNSNSNNYYYDLQWNESKSIAYEFLGNIDFDIRITKDLTFSSVNNVKINSYTLNNYTDPRSSSGKGVNGRLYDYSLNSLRRYSNQLFRFHKMIGTNSLSAIFGYEFNDFSNKAFSAKGTGFVPGFKVQDITSKPEAVGGSRSEWAMQSILFNANYSCNSKYYAQFSLRRDGASNFGDNAKYGNFFSISGGWNVTREDWFKVDGINNLKLRASYGSVGNRPDSLYPQYDLYSLKQSYNEKSGALISQIGNKDLTWEKTFTTGLGIDLELFNKIRVSTDLYEKRTINLLYAVPISGITGVTSIWRNVGEVKNKGIDINVGVDILKQDDFKWQVDANIGSNNNKVVKLYGKQSQIILEDGSGISGSANKLLQPGSDSDSWFLREWAGVDPKNGDPLWFKTDDKGNRLKTNKYSEANQVKIDAYTPDFFGGISTNLSYEKWGLDANFGYSVGGKIYNYTRTEFDSDGAYTDRNQMKLMKKWSRWEKPGDIATHPKATYENKSNSNKASSRFLEDGSFFRCRNITLSYTTSFPKLNLSNIRFFTSGENLFVLTKYSGVDPEIPPSNGKITGATVMVYPSTKKFTFGMNITF